MRIGQGPVPEGRGSAGLQAAVSIRMVVVPRRTRGAMLHDGAMHAPDRRAAAFTQGRCASAQFAAMLGVQPLRGLRGRVVAQPGEQPVDVVAVPGSARWSGCRKRSATM